MLSGIGTLSSMPSSREFLRISYWISPVRPTGLPGTNPAATVMLSGSRVAGSQTTCQTRSGDAAISTAADASVASSAASGAASAASTSGDISWPG